MKSRTVLLPNKKVFVIQTKINGSRFWSYYRAYGNVKLFSNEFHANNHGKLLNKNHIIYERSDKKSSKTSSVA
jgi:hypothetical protein